MTATPPPAMAKIATLRSASKRNANGLMIAVLIALASAFLSEHYGAPAMLLAILIGLALHFLSDDPRSLPGLEFAARNLLRFGIALLGLRMNFGMFADLGAPIIVLLIVAVAMTIGFGVVAALISGQEARFGVLTGGAVAICGASAAMAISAVLPSKDRETAERDMVFTVIGVTMLSTLAMILYPVIGAALHVEERTIGIFLGATIHDVAQVVGAGFSVSEPAGEIAVLVKLIRVSMLAPVVLIAALVLRQSAPVDAKRPPLLPGFVVAFLALVLVNSVLPVPAFVTASASEVSRWALLAAIAAVGVKTSLPKVLKVGRRAILLLVAQTAFLAVLICTALMLMA